MWLPSLFQVLSLVWLCSAAWFPLESTQDWDAGTWLFPLLEAAGFSATHCLNELHPEHATQLAVKNRKHFGTHFPFVGWERKQTWALANTDTIKMETESCLALGAVWDEPWVTPLGCVPAKTPGLDWRHGTSTLKCTYRWSPGAWGRKGKGKSVSPSPQNLDQAVSFPF